MRIYARDEACGFRFSRAAWGAFSNFQPVAPPPAGRALRAHRHAGRGRHPHPLGGPAPHDHRPVTRLAHPRFSRTPARSVPAPRARHLRPLPLPLRIHGAALRRGPAAVSAPRGAGARERDSERRRRRAGVLRYGTRAGPPTVPAAHHRTP